MWNTKRLILALGTASLLPSQAAHAGGLYVAAYGPSAQAQAGAYVATADDAMAIFTNPAGLARQPGTSIQVGSSFIDYSLAFTRRGAYDAVNDQDLPWAGQPYASVTNDVTPALGVGSYQAIPMLAAATSLRLGGETFVIAAGITAPPAYPARRMGADYVMDDPMRPPPPNRYDTVEQDAAIVLPSLAIGYAVNAKLSLGLRASWGYGNISSSLYAWALPNPNYEEWVGNEAKISVSAADDFVPQFSLGGHYKLSPHVELGAMWTSRAEVSARGEAQVELSEDLLIIGVPPEIVPVADEAARCAPGGTPEAIKTCVTFALPATFDLGARWIARTPSGGERASVEANVRLEQWRNASDFLVVVDAQALGIAMEDVHIRHGFRDAWSLRLGGNYRVSDAASAVVLRGGVAYDTAAAKPGWERVDLDGAARLGVSGGLSLEVGRHVRLDLAAAYMMQGTREVGGDCNPTLTEPGCKNGSQTPWGQRSQPDPVNPLRANVDQFESPYNSGRYESHYALLSAALSARW